MRPIIDVMAHVARGGVFHIHQARHDRAQLRDKAEAIVKAATESGKDLSGPALREFNECGEKIKQLSEQIENYMLNAVSREPLMQEHSATNLRDAWAHASGHEREQIENITAYLSGQIMASGADLKPSGDGGVIIPSFVTTTLERNYSAFRPVVSVARIWGTDTGADQVFPVLSDSEAAEQLAAAAATGADATVSGDTPPTDLAGPTLKAYKVSSKPVFCPRETFTDSPVNVIEEVVGALLARIIRFENLKYTKGNGTTEAEGFTTNCETHAVGDVAIDLDLCLDLAYAVPQLYRPQGVYMMSDTTARYLRKLKTGIAGDKQQLWADADATKGMPPSLHGYPVVINDAMDSVGADGKFTGKNPVAFGDFKKFVVRQAENNQPYAYRYSVPARDGSAVILFRRSDSKLLISEAIYKLGN